LEKNLRHRTRSMIQRNDLKFPILFSMLTFMGLCKRICLEGQYPILTSCLKTIVQSTYLFVASKANQKFYHVSRILSKRFKKRSITKLSTWKDFFSKDFEHYLDIKTILHELSACHVPPQQNTFIKIVIG
jgi:hypothetical protein